MRVGCLVLVLSRRCRPCFFQLDSRNLFQFIDGSEISCGARPSIYGSQILAKTKTPFGTASSQKGTICFLRLCQEPDTSPAINQHDLTRPDFTGIKYRLMSIRLWSSNDRQDQTIKNNLGRFSCPHEMRNYVFANDFNQQRQSVTTQV